MKRRRPYEIVVPISQEDRQSPPPSPPPSSSSSSSSNNPIEALQLLPTPLRLLFYVCVVNFCWLVFFSSHHFEQTNTLERRLRAVDEQAVLVVIISNRLEGVLPTVSSILHYTHSKPVDLVMIGDQDVNEQVRQQFALSTANRSALHHFTSLTVADVEADLQAQGLRPIWTWPEWGSSIRNESWFNPEHTLHVADWDHQDTHAHELNHLRFYLPMVSYFHKHRYLYFLDDDILVQKDLGHVVDLAIRNLDSSKGLVTPCNIWIWNSTCQQFGFQGETSIRSILNMPALYGDRTVCRSPSESHCYPASYPDFLQTALPRSGDVLHPEPQQKAWNFGFSLFALDNWRSLDLTKKYEMVMKKSYEKHVFPETSQAFGLGASYLAFAGAVECWKDTEMKVRDGFGFVDWERYAKTFGDDFMEHTDVIHYTGPQKPWMANTTIDPPSLKPWLYFMKQENMTIPDLFPVEPANELFSLLASDRTGATWIMSTLDHHPSICASGQVTKPESGFPDEALSPDGNDWLPTCNVWRSCSFGFVRDSVLELRSSMDRRGRNTVARCHSRQASDPLGKHLPRICNFVNKLRGNFSEIAIEALWVDAFRKEDRDLVGCSCPPGTTIKGLKVMTEWMAFANSTDGLPPLQLSDSALHGSKIIRLKRRNLWARYKSSILAEKSELYNFKSPDAKRNQLKKVGNITISIKHMQREMIRMAEIDALGDKWAKQHGSNILWLEYEDCRDYTAACFQRAFDFLGVDSAFVSEKPSLFGSTFAVFGDEDSSLLYISNDIAVRNALVAYGFEQYLHADELGKSPSGIGIGPIVSHIDSVAKQSPSVHAVAEDGPRHWSELSS